MAASRERESPRDPTRFLELAGAVADGAEVRWDEPGSSGIDDGDALARLRDVARIIQGFSSVLPGEEPESPAQRGRSAPSPRFRWGPLEVHERIGSGAFGDVYRAVDTRLELDVALKLTRDDAAEAEHTRALLDEARQMARVRHPNVVAVHGADIHCGRAGFWMDYIRGPTLEEVLRERGPLPPLEVARVGLDVCSALGAVHGAQLVHGDVKPGNILLGTHGNAMLTDLGAVSERSRDGARWVRATPMATAPEVWRGEPISPAADVYALGVVLFRALTATWPVEGDSVAEIAASHERARPVRLKERRPDLPDRLVEVVERAMDPDPAERPASAGMLRRDLAAAAPSLDQRPDHDDGPADEIGTNLPVLLSSFVGRERELREIAELAEQSRLLSLTGAGGSGKTRLALEVGSRHAASYAGGVRWVVLAEVADRAGVLERLTHVLGLTDPGGGDALPRLCAHLTRRRLLLVLDNCEHVRNEIAEIAGAILAACPAIDILATSREPLRIAGEIVYRLPPLEVPEVDADPQRACASTDAAKLFVDRAAAARHDFELTASAAEAVVTICRRVEGLPLAVELAASRVSGLAVEDVARALCDHLDLLGGPSRGGPPRHRTVEALIEWSHDLLSVPEQALFRRLAVFRGGWCAQDAGIVCEGAGVGARDVPTLLASLTEKSLVELDPRTDGDTRYRMLATVHAYAERRLSRDEGRAFYERRHAEHFLAKTAEASSSLAGAGRADAIDRLEHDHDNLRAALETLSRDDADPSLGVELGAGLGEFWKYGGHWREGLTWCRALLSRGAGVMSSQRATLLRVAGRLEFLTGDKHESLAHFEASLRMCEGLGDRAGGARALQGIGSALEELGDLDRAHDAFQRALTAVYELNDTWGVARAQVNLALLLRVKSEYEQGFALAKSAEGAFRDLRDWYHVANTLCLCGNLAKDIGRLDEAIALCTDAFAIAKRIENRNLGAVALTGLASVYLDAGKLDDARNAGEAALATFHELGSIDEAIVLRFLALVSIAQGRLELARSRLKRALHLRLEQKAERRIAIVVWTYGRLALACGKPDVAARLQGAARAYVAALGTPAYFERLHGGQSDEEAVRSALAGGSYETHHTEGEEMTLDDAIRLALAACG